MKYSEERREAILQKLLAPNNQNVAEAEGISAATLYLWRKQARAAGRLLPSTVVVAACIPNRSDAGGPAASRRMIRLAILAADSG